MSLVRRHQQSDDKQETGSASDHLRQAQSHPEERGIQGWEPDTSGGAESGAVRPERLVGRSHARGDSWRRTRRLRRSGEPSGDPSGSASRLWWRTARRTPSCPATTTVCTALPGTLRIWWTWPRRPVSRWPPHEYSPLRLRAGWQAPGSRGGSPAAGVPGCIGRRHPLVHREGLEHTWTALAARQGVAQLKPSERLEAEERRNPDLLAVGREAGREAGAADRGDRRGQLGGNRLQGHIPGPGPPPERPRAQHERAVPHLHLLGWPMHHLPRGRYCPGPNK